MKHLIPKAFASLFLGFTATLLSLCCALPLLFIALGISTSTLSFLRPLQPYRLYMLTMAGVFIVLSFGLIFIYPAIKQKALSACEAKRLRYARVLFILSLALLLLAYMAPQLLNVYVFG